VPPPLVARLEALERRLDEHLERELERQAELGRRLVRLELRVGLLERQLDEPRVLARWQARQRRG
jgi:hypothetical protein